MHLVAVAGIGQIRVSGQPLPNVRFSGFPRIEVQGDAAKYLSMLIAPPTVTGECAGYEVLAVLRTVALFLLNRITRVESVVLGCL